MRWKFAVVALAMLSSIGGVEGANPPIHLDDNGKLVYVPDEKGNIVPDYFPRRLRRRRGGDPPGTGQGRGRAWAG